MPILFQFDLRTVALFVGMVFFVQASAIGAQAFLIRELKQYRGVVAALLANLCVAVGLMLRLLVGHLPLFLTTILSNVMLLTGLGLFYVALSQFTGLSYSKLSVIGVIAVIVSVLTYFTYWNDDVGKRMIAISLGSIAIVLLLIYQLWRTRDTALRFSADLMLVSFLVHGTFLIVRTISLIRNPVQETSGLSPIQSATYLLSFAISFFWSMGFILMVSQRLRNDMMELAMVDALTRIPNRGTTQIFLEKELSRTQRNNSEFAVLLLDLDNFKQVNDRWGHAVGDQVLVRIAALFKSLVRKQDWVGRWGGEEFLVILPGTPHCDAETLAERLRSEVAACEFSQAAEGFRITVSIGIACATQFDQIDRVLKTADDALYEAKQTKNAVSLGSQNPA